MGSFYQACQFRRRNQGNILGSATMDNNSLTIDRCFIAQRGKVCPRMSVCSFNGHG